MISLLCPTRKRTQSLNRLVRSLIDTIEDKKQVELLIAVDLDDEASLKEVPILVQNPEGLIIREFRKVRTEWLNKDYYNYLGGLAKGGFLMAIGDDVVFKTKGFDRIITSKFDKYLKDKPDRVAYATVEDGTDAKHCCFPIITKEAFEVLGMFLHPELKSWGADRTIYEIYSVVNRVLDIPEVEVAHMSYHNGSAPMDETAREIKARFFENPNAHNEVSQNVVPKQIEQVRRFINERMEPRA